MLDQDDETENNDAVDIPKEYSDISLYMTQVLETMMERQRLEMHKKLNEMFKTYFDAKTTNNDVEDDIDKELNELRQAAIKSTAKEDEDENEKPVNFDNFHQFKKYKQKMRDQGSSLIVSIPNLNGTYDIIKICKFNASSSRFDRNPRQGT